MGHVVNPISFRLTKTKFSFNTWISSSKIRFSPLLISDFSLNKFIQWYLTCLEQLLLKQNLLINNFKIIRNYSKISINLNFVEILNNVHKKKKFNKKKFNKNFFYQKKNKFSKNFFFKKTYKKRYSKEKKSVLFFYLKKKKKTFKKRQLLKKKLNKFYIFNLIKFLEKYSAFPRYFSCNKTTFFFRNYLSKIKINKKQLLKKKYIKKYKPPHFLIYFRVRLCNILNIFFKKFSTKFIVNIFLRKSIEYSNILSQFVQIKLNQGFMIKYLITRLNYKIKSLPNILGYKLYYSGRSSKKLRNFPVVWGNGFLGLSNSSVPLDYVQIALWTKKGIIGLKIWLLKKMKKNEIF